MHNILTRSIGNLLLVEYEYLTYAWYELAHTYELSYIMYELVSNY